MFFLEKRKSTCEVIVDDKKIYKEYYAIFLVKLYYIFVIYDGKTFDIRCSKKQFDKYQIDQSIKVCLTEKLRKDNTWEEIDLKLASA